MGLVLLLGPIVIEAAGWRALWWAFTLLPLALAALVWRRIEPDPPHRIGADGEHRAAPLVIATLTCPGCWLLAGAFACYAGQWMSVFGFLPTFYRSEGLSGATAGLLTAVGALVNVTGNFGSGLLLQRGIAAHRLLLFASAMMLVCAWVLFGSGLPFGARYAAVLVFSAVGGLIPGTLFALTHRFAPAPQAVSTTTGLMQQGSSTGQFVIPPVLATVVSTTGGWSLAWTVTGALALINVGLALTMRRRG
jgi:cyanate permease